MNKTEAISKINKMGKIGSIVCLIGKIILIIAAVVTLAATIAFFVLPKDFVTVNTTSHVNVLVNTKMFTAGMSDEQIAEMKKGIEESGSNNSAVSVNDDIHAVSSIGFDNNVITVDTDATAKAFTLGKLRGVMVVALLSIACSLLSFFFGGSLCKAFAKCESPFEEVIITKMRYLAFSLIPMAILSCFSDSLVNGVVSGGKSISFSLNITSIFVILIILAVSYIFKYGAQLQQESDETL